MPVAPLRAHVPATAEARIQAVDSPPEGLHGGLDPPLEGRVRLRHVRRDADVEVQPLVATARPLLRLPEGLRDPIHVLERLGGKADHEVELDAAPSLVAGKL